MSSINSPITQLFIHCSDSPHRGDSAKDVHVWHMRRGWSGVGYHYLIDEFGTIERGRPEYWIGAHVKNANTGSLGICMLGVDEFTPAQWHSLRELVIDITTRYPEIQVRGHYEVDPGKTCPNFDVQKWLVESGLK